MQPRGITSAVLAALSDTPVVFLSGARQVGKSTLAQMLARGPHQARYLTLDDGAVFAAASADPQGFIDGLEGNVALDEVQRVPALLVAIKAAVDRDRRPGRFLLTGSADVLQLPRIANPLVGRVEVVRLWPLSAGELRDHPGHFVDAAFGEAAPQGDLENPTRDTLLEILCRGGYPEAQRRTPARRARFFESYLQTMLLREVRELSAIEDTTRLPRLLGLLATRTGSHLNVADIARSSGSPQATVRRDLALLRTLFLLELVPAWSGNPGHRLLKSPKPYVSDPGLATHLLGQDPQRLRKEPTAVGGLLETFVLTELAKQLGWSETPARLYHLRTQRGLEVDAVLEDRAGRCVAIEVKAATSLSERHLRGIQAFAEIAGDRFHRGLVLYGGSAVVPFARNVHALPIGSMWTWGLEAG